MAVHRVMEYALTRDYRVHFLGQNESGRVTARDISNLDPSASSVDESEWGGLTGFSSRFGEAVRKAVNEFDQNGNREVIA